MKPYIRTIYTGQHGTLSDSFQMSLEPTENYPKEEQAKLLAEARRMEKLFPDFRLSKPDQAEAFLEETKGRGCLWLERKPRADGCTCPPDLSPAFKPCPVHPGAYL